MQPYFIFWHGETRVLFLHVLFETKYKPNETKPTVDVQIQSCEALQSCGTQIFVFSRNTGEREALLMKHCSDVKHSSLDVNLCMSVEFVLSFACLWTHLDRVGLQFFLLFCNVLDGRHVSRDATTCMLLRMSGT